MADEKPEKGKGKGGKEGGGDAPAGGAPQEKAKPEGAKAKGGDGAKGGGKGAGGKGGGKPGDKGQGKKKAAPAERKEYKRTELPRLRQLYDKEVRERLRTEFNYQNAMQIPRLVKITLNMGLGRAVATPKIMEGAVEEMKLISGQAPVVTQAKKDIANFKLRAGHKIGVMVTLRRERMWEFLDRFINIALPRVRDFKGVSPKAFDGRGNYSLGVKEQIIFPEIDYDNIDSVKGMNVTIVTTAATDEEGRALLRNLGMPFRQPSAPAGTQATAEGAHA